MREIKFNFWDSKNNIMYENPAQLALCSTGGVSELEFHDDYLEWRGTDNTKDITPLQYTGLKDKNGVEIYEGDIISWKDLSEASDGTLSDTVVVFWDDEYLRWSIETLGYVKAYEKLYDYSNSDEIEVIGNIYENPEMIN